MLSYQTEYRLQGLFFDFSTQNFIVVLYSLSSHQMMGNCLYRLLLVDFQISVARRKYPMIFVISFGCIDEIWSDVVNSVSESWLLSQRTTNWIYLGIFFSWETSRGRIIWHVRNILKHSCFRPLSYWVYTLYGTLEINYFNHVLGAFFVSIHLFTFLHHFFLSSGFLCKINSFCLNGECFTITSCGHPKGTQLPQHWKNLVLASSSVFSHYILKIPGCCLLLEFLLNSIWLLTSSEYW